MAERVFKMVKQGATMPEALASLASETADKAVRLADFLRRFRLADYFKIEQEQFGNALVPIQKGLNAYTKLSLRSGEVGMWKEDVFQELKYYENEEGLAEILRSTVEEAAATKIQCLVRGHLVRKRYMKKVAHYERRLLMLLYPDESAAKLSKRWLKRMYRRGFLALPKEDAAVRIQCLVRGYLVRKRCTAVLGEMRLFIETAATKIQSLVRGYLKRKNNNKRKRAEDASSEADSKVQCVGKRQSKYVTIFTHKD